MMESDVEIVRFEQGPLQTNCYLIVHKAARKAVIIDPALHTKAIELKLSQHQCILERILLTHAHHDHVCATKALAEATGAPVLLHPADQPLYDSIDRQAREFGFPIPDMVPINRHVVDG